MRFEPTPMEKAKNRAAELAQGSAKDLIAEVTENAIYACMGDFGREIRPEFLLFELLCLFTDPQNTGREYDAFKKCLLDNPDEVETSLMAYILDVLFMLRYDAEHDPAVYKAFEAVFDYRKTHADAIGLYEFSRMYRLVNGTEYGDIIENYIHNCFIKNYKAGTMSFTYAAAAIQMQKNIGYRWMPMIPSYDESFERIKMMPEVNETVLLDIVGISVVAEILGRYKIFKRRSEDFLPMCKDIVAPLMKLLETPEKRYYNYVFECVTAIIKLAQLWEVEFTIPDFSRFEIVASACKAMAVPELEYNAKQVLRLAGVTI